MRPISSVGTDWRTSWMPTSGDRAPSAASMQATPSSTGMIGPTDRYKTVGSRGWRRAAPPSPARRQKAIPTRRLRGAARPTKVRAPAGDGQGPAAGNGRGAMPIDFALSDEQRLLIETVRHFVATEIYPHEEAVDRAGSVPPELGRQIAERAITLGLFAANMPES